MMSTSDVKQNMMIIIILKARWSTKQRKDSTVDHPLAAQHSGSRDASTAAAADSGFAARERGCDLQSE